jgi:hemerythrin-like domain-containing protein
MTTRTSRGRTPALFVASVAAALVVTAGALAARRRTHKHEEAGRADVGFMRAMHAALRRDMARLESVAPRVEGSERIPAPVEAGWVEFRDELGRHHDAEDDDLWPVLRSHLSAAKDHHEVDQMVEEHRALAPAIDAVEAALSNGTGIDAAAAALGDVLHRHLDHEERAVFPLLERHLSRREWRAFLVTERRRTPLRHRPEFLTWVLDDASEADTEAVMAELPPPGRLVYRRVLRPRYAAKHRWQSDEPVLSRAS